MSFFRICLAAFAILLLAQCALGPPVPYAMENHLKNFVATNFLRAPSGTVADHLLPSVAVSVRLLPSAPIAVADHAPPSPPIAFAAVSPDSKSGAVYATLTAYFRRPREQI